MLTHVFLDFGGTLAHERPSRAALYAAAAGRFGRPVSEQEMAASMARAHGRMPRRWRGAWRYTEQWFLGFMESIFVDELGLDPRALDELAGELFARFADPTTFRLYPHARELVTALDRAGIAVGIVSNWSPALPGLVRGLGLAPPVETIVASAEVGLEKPDPAIFTLALERSGARPEDSLHAGDRPDLDCLGARAAGLQVVLVDHLGTGRAAREGDLRRVRSLTELRTTILGGP